MVSKSLKSDALSSSEGIDLDAIRKQLEHDCVLTARNAEALIAEVLRLRAALIRLRGASTKDRDALQHIMQVLGPSVPETCENHCDGCLYEMFEALRTLRDVGIEYESRSPDGDGPEGVSMRQSVSANQKDAYNTHSGASGTRSSLTSRPDAREGSGGKPMTVNTGDGCSTSAQTKTPRLAVQGAGSEPADSHQPEAISSIRGAQQEEKT